MNHLGENVLYRLAGCDVMSGDLVIVRPLQNGFHGRFDAVVADDDLRLAAIGQEPIEFAGDPNARDRGIGDNAGHSRAVDEHDQGTHATAVDELVGNEVERPTIVR